MVHIIYHDAADEVVLYDDEQRQAISAEREFNHALVRMLTARPNFSIRDPRSGTTYEIFMEAVPGEPDDPN